MKNRHGIERVLMGLGVCLTLWLAAGVRAEDTHVWIGGSGFFPVTDNWNTGIIPSTTNDYARFTTNTAITIQFTESVTNNRVRVETSTGGRGQISWDLGGNEYRLVSQYTGWPPENGLALTVGRSGGVDLYVTNGNLHTYGFMVTGGGSLRLAGTNTSWYSVSRTGYSCYVGYSTTESLVRLSEGAKANLQAVILSSGSNTRGALEVTGHDSVLTNREWMTVGFYGHGRLVARDGGRIEVATDIRLNFDARIGTHIGSGTLEVDGGAVFARDLNNGASGGDTNAHLRVTLYEGGTNALVALTRNLTINTGFKFHLTLDDDFSADLGEVFTIVQVGGAVTGNAGLFENPLAGNAPLTEGAILVYDQGPFEMMPYEFQVSYQGGTSGKDFTLTVVPEPLTLSLLGAAGLALWAWRRRLAR